MGRQPQRRKAFGHASFRSDSAGPPSAFVGLVAAVVLASSGCGAGGAGRADKDADLVWCLSARNQALVAEAAFSLKLVSGIEPGTRVVVDQQGLSIEDWRSRRPADFDRACTAAVAAYGTGAGGAADAAGGEGTSSPLLMAVLTAALTLLASILTAIASVVITARRNEAARLRQLVDDIREQLRTVEHEGKEYFASFEQQARRIGPERLVAAMDGLCDRLNQMESLRPTWSVLPALRRLLREPPLADGFHVRLLPQHEAAAELRAVTERALADRVTLARVVTDWMKTPVRCSRRLRGVLPQAPGDTKAGG